MPETNQTQQIHFGSAVKEHSITSLTRMIQTQQKPLGSALDKHCITSLTRISQTIIDTTFETENVNLTVIAMSRTTWIAHPL